MVVKVRILLEEPNGVLAQLSRASVCLTEGHGFEPHIPRQIFPHDATASISDSGSDYLGSNPSGEAIKNF